MSGLLGKCQRTWRADAGGDRRAGAVRDGRDPLRIGGAPEDHQLVGSVRDRAGGDDSGHRDRARDGDRARSRLGSRDRLHHVHRLRRVSAARRAIGDDARPLRRPAVLRLSGVQSPVAAVRRARQRLYRVGVLAGVVPGGAAEHDPRVAVYRRPLSPFLVGLLAAGYVDHLVDARDLDRRADRARDPRRSGPAVRDGVRDDARDPVDDPADVPGDLVGIPSVGRPFRPAVSLPAHRRHRLLLEPVRPQLADVVHRLLVPVDLERDRDGGRRLLHRRDPQPRSGREDRDEPRGPLRAVHLHDDPGRVHHRDRRPFAPAPVRASSTGWSR